MAACGLDSFGLAGDDGGVELAEAGIPFDGTLESEDSGGVVTPDSAPSGGEDAGGEDVNIVPKDSGGDAPIVDAGPDTSCASPAFVCTVASVPTGWSIVEYVETSRPACSPGFGSPLDVVEGPTGQPATCGCSCSVTTPGTCESGNFSVTTNSATPSCGGVPVNSPANGGACAPATIDYSPKSGAQMQVVPAPYAPGSCTPDPTEPPPPAVQYAGQGELCFESTTPGGTCANGGVCAPAATGGGFALCIEATGIQSCPTGFVNPAHYVGTSVTDTRGCTACTCGPADAGPCQNAMLTLYTDAGCGGGAQSVNANGACGTFPGPTSSGLGPPTYVAYEYSAHVQNEGCPASPVYPDGGVTLTTPNTVCCQ
jgi:hypothetical protein